MEVVFDPNTVEALSDISGAIGGLAFAVMFAGLAIAFCCK